MASFTLPGETRTLIERTIDNGQLDAFIVLDLDDVKYKFAEWTRLLPRVKPFYAVKCNPDERVMSTLLNCGTGFDCASKSEIQQALALGARPCDIVYANPCKQPSHIICAKELGVEWMTFDSADEIKKVKKYYPGAKLILRIITDDSSAVCRLSNKFGAELSAVPKLLQVAKEEGVDVVGISYHCGSGCKDSSAFVDAVYRAHEAYKIASGFGFNITLLDIGGGFSGEDERRCVDPSAVTFSKVAERIRPVLDELFPPHLGIEIIAEPGRYFVHSCAITVTNIIGRRVCEKEQVACNNNAMEVVNPPNGEIEMKDSFNGSTGGGSVEEDDCYRGEAFAPEYAMSVNTTDEASPEEEHMSGRTGKMDMTEDFDKSTVTTTEYMYYVNDGLYGSFNCVLYDHQVVHPTPLLRSTATSPAPPKVFKSSVWGPTCDGLDCISKEVLLPPMQVGDWVFFPDTGAYTSAAGSNFNGFESPSRFYVGFD